MNSSINIIDAIRQLEGEIKEKTSALNVLYQLIGKDRNDGIVPVGSVEQAGAEPRNQSNGFPKTARTDKQVMYLFNNVFARAEKFATVQKKFNELLGAEKNVYNTCRALKKSGHLANIQYNGQNKLSFWGKGDWVGDRDFKEEYKPDPDEMPIEITDIKVLKEDDSDFL